MFYLWPHLLHIIEIRGANNYRHLVIFGSCQDIYYWWGCRVGFTPNTAAFCWRCFQTNKPLPKSELLVLITVYLKISNACKIIFVNIAIWLYSYPNHFDANRFRAHTLYDLILIRFLRFKFISNSFSMKPIRFYEQTTLIWSSVGGYNYNY